MATRMTRMLITFGSPYFYSGQCLLYTCLDALGGVETYVPRRFICLHCLISVLELCKYIPPSIGNRCGGALLEPYARVVP